MEIRVDGVLYVPAPDSNVSSDALDFVFDGGDLQETMTIREYLRNILDTLWAEEESFNSKRPFGNSGWQWDVYQALIRGGFIDGKLDSDGYIAKFDEKKANQFVRELITKQFCVDSQ